MSNTYIPGPNNEIIVKSEPSHSQFPIPAAEAAVFADTASYVIEAANWSQKSNTLSVVISASADLPYPIISSSIVNITGCPVFVAYSGDMDAFGQPGASGRIQLYRDSIPIGTAFHFYTQSTFGSNPCVSVSCIDSPGTGSFTYYLKLVTLFGGIPIRFGNENGGNLSVFEIG